MILNIIKIIYLYVFRKHMTKIRLSSRENIHIHQRKGAFLKTKMNILHPP